MALPSWQMLGDLRSKCTNETKMFLLNISVQTSTQILCLKYSYPSLVVCSLKLLQIIASWENPFGINQEW